MGALAVGLGHTDIAYVLMNGKIWFKVPETIRFTINGTKPEYIMAKDIILKIIGDIGTDGANYKAMQFAGETVDKLSMEERLTLTNMSTEAGAKNGIIEPDDITFEYLKTRTDKEFIPVKGDSDASFSNTFTYDIETLDPVIAKPYSPENICAVGDIEGEIIDKAYIGSCTGAKLEDLRMAAKSLKENKLKLEQKCYLLLNQFI